MADTYTFTIEDPEVGEVAVATVHLYESDDGTTGWTEVDSIAVGALIDNGGGSYTWESAIADSSKYHQVVPASAGGVERAGSAVVPPVGDASETILHLTTYDIVGIARQGVQLTITGPETATAVGSSLLDPRTRNYTTDDVGFVEASVIRGVTYTVSTDITSGTIEVDTTGESSINLAPLLTA